MEKIKQQISKLNHDECMVYKEFEEGRIEVWKVHNMYMIFEIPQYEGIPQYIGVFYTINEVISQIEKLI